MSSSKGIDDTSFKIIYCSMKIRLKNVIENMENIKNINKDKKIFYFVKDFG